MRIESSVTSISWIPSEAISGMAKLPFETGIAHYDEPPPDDLDDGGLAALKAAGRFRFANELRAWIEVSDGEIVDCGYSAGGHIGETTLKLGSKEITFAAVPLPDLRRDPEIGDGYVKFVQTAGGRTGAPAPRRVRKRPFFQIDAPTAWTTLALTIDAGGSARHEVVGASPFPRHWIYDAAGKLVEKTGLIDFKTWFREDFGKHTPWGDQETPAFVTEVESALERTLSTSIMSAEKKPRIKKLPAGKALVRQGERGEELFLLLDGALVVEVDGEALATVGPGAIVGERALVESGLRTSTLRATTPCRVAVVARDEIDEAVLLEVGRSHRREEAGD